MTSEEKNKFDRLNSTSYILRILLEQQGFDIQPIVINNDRIYHVLKNGHTIGTLISRYDENIDLYHNNIRLYKYFKERFPKAQDFLMSEYWEYNDNIRTRFNFEKFNDWCQKINTYIESFGVNKSELKLVDTFNDSINRLIELVDEYDEKFSSNSLIKDIRRLLNEYDKLNNELKKKNNQFFDLFTRIKI